MVPGKKFTAEDILRIAFRRKWFIVLPLVIGLAASVLVASRLPKEYRSETLIMLMPQRIPDSYVKSAVTIRIEDRLATLSEQILSRSRLERIIVDLGIYQDQRATGVMEDVVERMRRDIHVTQEGKESFRVTYVSRDAKTAKNVTERLASLFIDENLRDRANLAEDTSQFLDSQLEDAKRRLIEHEKKLEEYRRRYSGQLPSQAASNLQSIQNTQVQLQSLVEASDRARERRLLVERQLADAQTPDPIAVVAPGSGSPDAAAEVSTAQQLETAKARLDLLLTRAKPDHPDVRFMQRTVRDLQTKLDAETRDAAGGAAPARPLAPAEAQRQKRVRDLTAQLADVDRELQDKQQQERRLRGVIADYQNKLDVVPTRESELVELTRDYATLQTSYQVLLAKREESKIAVNLERKNIGEQFRVLDPARVPERPFSPNRPQIEMMGAAVGLLVGLSLVALLEYRDTSFTVEADVVRVIALPVLAVIPQMTSALDREIRRRRRILSAAAILAIAACTAVLIVWRLQS